MSSHFFIFLDSPVLLAINYFFLIPAIYPEFVDIKLKLSTKTTLIIQMRVALQLISKAGL